MIQALRRRQKEPQSGQGVVEYVLGVLLILGIFGVVNAGMKKGVVSMWKGMAALIAAPCPRCEPPEVIGKMN
jgi:hypothetical protein